MDKVIGKKAVKDIEKNVLLKWDDFSS